MAVTVFKYSKTLNSEVITTPRILVKSIMQKVPRVQNVQQQQNCQNNVTPNKSQESSNLVIKKISDSIKSSQIMKRSTEETKTDSEPVSKSTKYTVQMIPSNDMPSTSSQDRYFSNNANGSISLDKDEKQQEQSKQMVTKFDSFKWTATPQMKLTAVTSTTTRTPTATSTMKKQPHLLPVTATNQAQSTYTKSNSSNNKKNCNNTKNNKNKILISNNTSSVHASVHALQMHRSTIVTKREIPQSTVQTVTIELIEKSPFVHLGIHLNRMPILKDVICPTAGVTLLECYITLKKLRTNEDITLLAQYFDISEVEIQQIFGRTVMKLARYMRFLIRWPEHKKHTDRRKTLPFAFRQNHLHVQSLMECVETTLTMGQWRSECSNYKYLICFDPTGIITYVSEIYIGECDDICIMEACNFKESMPQCVMLMVDPGKAIRRKQDPCKRAQQELTHIVQASTSTTTTRLDFDATGIDIGDDNRTGTFGSAAINTDAAGNVYSNGIVDGTAGRSGTNAVAVAGAVNGIDVANTTADTIRAASCELEDSTIVNSFIEAIGKYNNANEDALIFNDSDAVDTCESDDDNGVEDNAQSLSRYAASQLAGEFASQRTLSVVNDQLTSKFIENFSIPTTHVRQNLLRSRISDMIKTLREFKILKNLAIGDVGLCKYLNDILVVCAALTNLQK